MSCGSYAYCSVTNHGCCNGRVFLSVAKYVRNIHVSMAWQWFDSVGRLDSLTGQTIEHVYLTILTVTARVCVCVTVCCPSVVVIRSAQLEILQLHRVTCVCFRPRVNSTSPIVTTTSVDIHSFILTYLVDNRTQLSFTQELKIKFTL